MFDEGLHLRRMVGSDMVSTMHRCRIAQMKNPLVVLVLLVHFMGSMSCSIGHEETSNVTEAPVEVVFTDVKPAVTALVGRLLDDARNDPRSGSRRGQLGIAYEIHGFPNAA